MLRSVLINLFVGCFGFSSVNRVALGAYWMLFTSVFV